MDDLRLPNLRAVDPIEPVRWTCATEGCPFDPGPYRRYCLDCGGEDDDIEAATLSRRVEDVMRTFRSLGA